MSYRGLFSLIPIILSALCCCSAEGEPDNPSQEETVDTEVEDREGFSVKGLVLADGCPLAGAVVSDGCNVTQTDFDGKYWLRSTTGEDVVWISIPSGYEVPVDDGWSPRFWYRLDTAKVSTGEVQRFDFNLTAVNQDRFALCVFTDTHIRGRNSLGNVSAEMDSLQFRKYLIPKVQSWDGAHAGVPRYALVLGDMIQDYAVTEYKTGLPEYKRCLRGLNIPIFHIPGNHDYTPDMFLERSWEKDPEARDAKQYFISHLGPTYYSFSVGKVHFVMLDGTTLVGGGALNTYVNTVSPRQIAWLRKDLVRADKSMHLVIGCHQPFYTYKGGTSSIGTSCISNRNEIIEMASGFNGITILSGHTHFGDIANLTVSGTSVNQYTHPAVCGPFWLAHINYDGSPNGYTSYEFSGDSFTRRQYTMDDAYDYRAILYTDYTDENGDNKLVINVPAFEEGWELKVLENNVVVGEPVRTRMKDPGYDRIYTSNGFPSNTYTRENTHIWLYTPVSETALFKISVTTSTGEEFSLEGKIGQ